MNKSVLVTTGLLASKNYEVGTYFLGQWCLTANGGYGEQEYSIQKHHWSDNNKLSNDYVYLEGLIERVLLSLAKALNNYHQVNRSIRYWRIILGPWLFTYLPIYLFYLIGGKT